MREIVSPLDGFPSPFGRISGSGAAPDAYAIGGASPELVAAFLTAADGTTEGEYFRTGGSVDDFSMFTFSRSDNATMYDSTGTLVWAPHNLAEDSEDISQWKGTFGGGNPSPVVTANAAEAPDGTMTADLVVFDKTVDPISFCRVGTSASPLVVGVEYTLKFWVRTSDGTSKTAYLQPLNTDLGIEYPAVTGDWQLFEYTFTATGTSSTVLFGLRGTNSDDTLSVYFWGCHVYRSDLGGMADNPDQPAGLEKYVPTTSAAVYLSRRNAYYYNSGVLTKGGLRWENAAATNLIEHSGDFTQAASGLGGWLTLRLTATMNAVGPDGVANSAATLTDTGTGGTSTTQIRNDTVTLSLSTTYCYSFFAKSGTLNWVIFNIAGLGTVAGNASFDLSSGTVGSVNANYDDARIEYYGDGWYRCSITFTTDGVDATGNLRIFLGAGDDNTSVPQDGTSSILLYGAQLETGPIATSYIPTTGSTVTRPAETLSIAAANLPYSATAMSISMKGLMTYADTGTGFASNGTFGEVVPFTWRVDSSNYIFVCLSTSLGSTGELVFAQEVSSVFDRVSSSTTLFSPGVNVPFNIASRHGSTFINGAVDGTAFTADVTPTSLPDLSATELLLGRTFNGFISEFRMWGTDIGDSGIAEVTT